MARGYYWIPIFREFTKIFPETLVFTGIEPGFIPDCEDDLRVKVVGRTRFFCFRKTSTGYDRGVSLPSFRIIRHLVDFKPEVIFSSGFSLWTAISLLLKYQLGWKVIIVYDGSSLNIDAVDSKSRLLIRRIMASQADAFITNSHAGRNYLVDVLKVEANRVFAKPYEVPDANALLSSGQHDGQAFDEVKRPAFLFVGQIIPRKGLHLLLEACLILKKHGYDNFMLVIVGDGPQRSKHESLVMNWSLGENVRFTGWMDYGYLGSYFQSADIFVFPTLEDIWGMVVLEAMVFGKSVLCSKWAGAAEMIVEGKNGYVFDPYQPEQLAELMKRFIENPELIRTMGEHSKQFIASYTPKSVAKAIGEVIEDIIKV